MEYDTNSTITNIIYILKTPKTYQVFLGCLIYFLFLSFVLIPLNRFLYSSNDIILLVSFFIIVRSVISQTEVYNVIGEVNNLKTIFLLWGMMVISSYFERERLIDHLLNKLFPCKLAFHWWIVRLSIIDSILAALFTNDVA